MEKPTSITVFGVLNLVFGGLAVVAIPFSLLVLLMPRAAASNPVLQIMQSTTFLRCWTYIGSGLGLLATIVLVACGVGLLQSRAWARRWSIYYAVYAIAAAVAGLIVQVAFLLPPVLEKVRYASDPVVVGTMVGGVVGGIFGTCFGLIYPIVLLFFMTRPRVKEYLEWHGQRGETAGGPDPDPPPGP